ncbi:hypothetical protein JOC58_000308 [Paenibacillus hunanensis]|uniref:EamA family transporter n=1 Tax=Paenibacillus hunanensis TaxID=539262 RepID=A0ABU1IT51_9BACL|nr:hypothetical protein [Paenibacillus hunanensis]
MNPSVKDRCYAVLGIAIIWGGVVVIKLFSGDL